MTRPEIAVADLHCDLLDYLCAKPERTPHDPSPRCSIPQLRAGGVECQVLAIFGMTRPGSSRIGPAQAAVFEELVREPADTFAAVTRPDEVARLPDGRIGVVAAIENASVFCEESEPLGDGLARLEEIERRVGRLLYVIMTWNDENRFGGGNASAVGLKADGRTLLEYLSGRGIALDFSHMSPALARESLEFIAARGLDVPVCASHSCYAALREHPRNIPDDVAREIIARGGVIGMNFLTVFLGEGGEPFADQVRHAIELGGAKHCCFGADFFTVEDLPPDRQALAPQGFYHPGFEDSSCYPRLLERLEQQVPCTREILTDLARGNLYRFWKRLDRA